MEAKDGPCAPFAHVSVYQVLGLQGAGEQAKTDSTLPLGSRVRGVILRQECASALPGGLARHKPGLGLSVASLVNCWRCSCCRPGPTRENASLVGCTRVAQGARGPQSCPVMIPFLLQISGWGQEVLSKDEGPALFSSDQSPCSVVALSSSA